MEAIGALRSATAGMASASRQLDTAAATIARGTVLAAPAAVAGRGGAADATAGGGGDLTGALLDEMVSVGAFGSNAAVARTADEILQESLRGFDEAGSDRSGP